MAQATLTTATPMPTDRATLIQWLEMVILEITNCGIDATADFTEQQLLEVLDSGECQQWFATPDRLAILESVRSDLFDRLVDEAWENYCYR